MANDAPDWQQLVQFPSAQQINIAGVQVASLPSQVVNAYLSAFGALVTKPVSMNFNNMAPNAGIGIMLSNLPSNNYDEVAFAFDSANGDLQKYVVSLSQQRYQTAAAGASFITPVSGTVTEKSNSAFDDNTKHFITNPVVLDPTFPTNALYLFFTNTSAAAITDTVTVTAFLKYSSDVVTNTFDNPVQTQGVHGNNSVPGSVTLPASTQTMAIGSANQVITRAIITPFNTSGATYTAPDHIIGFINGAEGFAIPLAGIVANDFGSPVTLNFGDGIALGANGIQLNPNIGCAATVTLVLKQ